jgi:hypothetical protein
MSTKSTLTEPAQRFLKPQNATHRQYEALRAFFVDKVPSLEAARRFGYSPGSFRVLVHRFRHDPQRIFFGAPGDSAPPNKGPQVAPKKSQARAQVIALRKQNLSM